MKNRKMWVIFINVDGEWKEHSRTGNRFESMKIFDALLKAHTQAYVEEHYF